MYRDIRPTDEPPGGATCVACGERISTDDRYCAACGAATGGPCPSCKETVQPGERFCRYCGTQVASFMSGRTPQPQVEPQSRHEAADAEMVTTPPAREDDLRYTERTSYGPPDEGGITCPRCGARSGLDDAFCNSCGLPFDEQEGQYPASEQAGFRYGGVLERLVARLIDGFILFAVLIAVMAVGGTEWILNEDDEITTQFNIIWFFVVIAYHSVFVSVFGTTPGKRVMGLRVSAISGRRPWFGQALVRELSTIISTLTLFIGYLIALVRPDRRTLHDLLAGTLVVSDKP